MKLLRELEITPGYDKRDVDPKKNYGIHGCDMRFYVLNPQRTRAVQFVCYTDWMPRKVQDSALHDPFTGRYKVIQEVVGVQPMAADLGYHSPRKLYKDQRSMECDKIKGGKCYYDGSTLAADRLRDVMLEEGSDGVWRELEQYYHEVFDKNRTSGGFGEVIDTLVAAVDDKKA